MDADAWERCGEGTDRGGFKRLQKLSMPLVCAICRTYSRAEWFTDVWWYRAYLDRKVTHLCREWLLVGHGFEQSAVRSWHPWLARGELPTALFDGLSCLPLRSCQRRRRQWSAGVCQEPCSCACHRGKFHQLRPVLPWGMAYPSMVAGVFEQGNKLICVMPKSRCNFIEDTASRRWPQDRDCPFA